MASLSVCSSAGGGLTCGRAREQAGCRDALYWHGLGRCAEYQVSIGFPGVVRADFVLTAPNLDNKEWHGFKLGAVLADALGKPVRMLNDASIQGLGVITGRGLECVLTMGTGMGFALFPG